MPPLAASRLRAPRARRSHTSRGARHLPVRAALEQLDAGALAAATAGAAAFWLGGSAFERRSAADGVGAATNGSRSYVVGIPPLFPLLPFFERATVRTAGVPGEVWCLEQKQGIGLGLNVAVNTRMTLVRLSTGGLLVYAPVAPTQECVRLVRQIEQEAGGAVEHVVLPTTLFEHKLFVGPFSREFPSAKVWVCPDQWSWPLNLPAQAFGIFPEGVVDDADSSGIPWADDFEIATLRPPPVGVNASVAFNEVAMCHKRSRTLLVTDAVVRVSDAVPEVLTERDLLYSGDDDNFTLRCLKFLNLFDVKEKEARMKRRSSEMSRDELYRLGWRRNALTALYFGVDNLLEPGQSWNAIAGRLIVAPVVGTLVYGNVPDAVLEWSERVAQWKFSRVIPAHLDGPVPAGPREWRAAFACLREGGAGGPLDALGLTPEWRRDPSRYWPPEDMVLLRAVNDVLTRAGVIFTDATRPQRRRARGT